MRVYQRITDTIGHTPLVELTNLEAKYNLKARIIAKVDLPDQLQNYVIVATRRFPYCLFLHVFY